MNSLATRAHVPAADAGLSPWRLCVAPMMARTDRHCRYFLRRLSTRARLYTEMITTSAVLNGDAALLSYDPSEHPVALQLGGSDPRDLQRCARLARDLGYDEVNLNVGCPSDRVSQARFGACLMGEPELVAECIARMRETVDIPVTVKTRIGIDERDSFAEFLAFIDRVSSAGCNTFMVHARKAWLNGLSPKQNRVVPPLNYEFVTALKRERPHLTVVINGGIADTTAAARHLDSCDGVMIGRAVYDDPYLLARLDCALFGGDDPPTRTQVIESLLAYFERQQRLGTPLRRMTRHLLGLFRGRPGARLWRHRLSTDTVDGGDGAAILREALRRMG
jgi:tRNA-dihydrouridine synthase A